MTLKAHLYLSVRNPNSYFAARQYHQLQQSHDIDIEVRTVYPLAIRYPEYFEKNSPLWIPYLIRDCHRYAEFMGMGFGLPKPDPIVQNLETLEISSEQPYIFRLARLLQLSTEQGAGLAFADHLLSLIWDGQTTDWDQGDHLARVARAAGLDLAELDRQAKAEAAEIDQRIFANQDTLHEEGHWYTPSLVFNGELFFSESRYDLALWRLEQHGLSKRI
ncbi:MAG: 2-hydroxychromene-2-carboxylate isomerase [Alphaproteobacteria bacterium]|mgnify:CR=1 FL=1|jgi:2-hydroxychromene-2-carboxylate isomerase|nr:2-hydroxychromene-2-carboxylate isomerase [Alphaproteobacteria bacterium]MBT4086010.1 2-hydroxychromene-2-carboxylate isomerase [Alphaproteobacteria bacterium]MBT4546560.1 2-hydroxychromene-2-carboxylate isomerase [Alphaproteobacteria bacterium]MBT7745961.1 2-hydroxychromene-2-carboxylate isomerase [Alphaproteobacteria bacterium]